MCLKQTCFSSLYIYAEWHLYIITDYTNENILRSRCFCTNLAENLQTREHLFLLILHLHVFFFSFFFKAFKIRWLFIKKLKTWVSSASGFPCGIIIKKFRPLRVVMSSRHHEGTDTYYAKQSRISTQTITCMK